MTKHHRLSIRDEKSWQKIGITVISSCILCFAKPILSAHIAKHDWLRQNALVCYRQIQTDFNQNLTLLHHLQHALRYEQKTHHHQTHLAVLQAKWESQSEQLKEDLSLTALLYPNMHGLVHAFDNDRSISTFPNHLNVSSFTQYTNWENKILQSLGKDM